MVKVISRYQIRILNHNKDWVHLIMIVAYTVGFLVLRYGFQFEQIGPPVVNFEPIVPKGSAIYTYYGIDNPKLKKDLLPLEISKDPFLHHFSFIDVTKIIPYSDMACPPDGIC